MNTQSTNTQSEARKPLRMGLWIAQALAATIFIAAGLTKLSTPIPELVKMIPWTGDFSEAFVRLIGLVDLAGGLGLLLPSVTRIQPNLTVLAAAGCLLLQVSAFGFHASRGEFDMLPVNLMLMGVLGFVVWGRQVRAPILARTKAVGSTKSARLA